MAPTAVLRWTTYDRKGAVHAVFAKEGHTCEEVLMVKLAVVVFADTESHADLGRVVNAMLVVREAAESGDDVRFIFDGAGTKWIAELENPDHRSHKLYQSVFRHISGACKYCAAAFGVLDTVAETGVSLLDEYHQHPSLRRLVADGYEVLVF